jgi:formylglycine-generating enzyme required for sulfatase activity
LTAALLTRSVAAMHPATLLRAARAAPLFCAWASLTAVAGARADAPAAGTRIQDCPHCPEVIVLPAGRLRLGTESAIQVPTEVPAELEPVEVRIQRPFAIGRFEVTRAQYAAFARATGRHEQLVRCRTWVESRQGFADLEIPWYAPNVPAEKRGDHPATCIDWHDARAYVEWLSTETGQRYRLPSEVEWEYAARAGTRMLRPWGNDPARGCRQANAHDRATARRYPLAWTVIGCDDGFADVAPVGRLAANRFGLHDMLGNVWEWTEDCSSLSYVGRPLDQRAWVWDGGCTRRIQRGGGWITGPERTRSGFHGDGHADDRADFAGLRVVREVVPVSAITPPTVTSRTAASPGTELPLRCAECPELVEIRPGSFALGTPADGYEHSVETGETPPLPVTIHRRFALGRFEVTQAQFARFVTATGHRPAHACSLESSRPPAAPVVCVTRSDVEAYLDWLRGRTGLAFRLPSEPEWEYATRAGTVGARFWSWRDSHEGVSISRACDFANVYDVAARNRALPVPHARCTDHYAALAPVGSFAPNPLGLYDMIGNARERVADCYTESYKGRPADERAWIWPDCRLQVVRGGSFLSRPFAARSAARDHVADDAPATELLDAGFRVALDLEPRER